MSDFFSGIYSGIKRPDVVMNDGPLPPMSINGGYPAGFNGAPDGKINYANSLLGDLDPYAYGEPARLSTQTAYHNIPHVAQRIVPTLQLPESQPYRMGGSFISVSHQVDDGDVAFVIRAMFSPFELVSEKKKFNRQGILYAIDPVVNLATVNYILHGLQRYGFDKRDHKTWNTLWIALGIDHHFQGRGNYDRVSFSEEMLETQKKLDELCQGQPDQKRTPQEALDRLYCTLKLRTMRRSVVLLYCLAVARSSNLMKSDFEIDQRMHVQTGSWWTTWSSTSSNPLAFPEVRKSREGSTKAPTPPSPGRWTLSLPW
jgi:hypothetical protein